MNKLIIALVAAAASTATAQDVVFTARTFDNSLSGGTANDPFKNIDAFSSATSSFLIGNNPISIAYDGSSVYIGGNVNGTPDRIAIAEISDFFNTGAAKNVPGSEVDQMLDPIGSGRGYAGLDWSDEFGLIAALDRGSTGAAGDQVFRWARNMPTDFSLSLQVSLAGLRGSSGVCYDYGFDGAGFLLSDGVTMGPAVVLPEFGRGGPYGFDPLTFDASDDIYDPDNPQYGIFNATAETAWRDYDIHPSNGLVVGRSNNIAVLGDRNAGNGTDNIRIITPPGGKGIFTTNQNVEIIHSPACGVDMVVLNDRPTSSSFGTLPNAVLLYDTAGNPMTYEVQLPDGTPVTFSNTATFYSFFWDEGEQILFVCDGTNRDVYALELNCGTSACPCDINGDGATSPDDINAFVTAFLAGQPEADIDGDGDQDPDDISAFVDCFINGAPTFPGCPS